MATWGTVTISTAGSFTLPSPLPVAIGVTPNDFVRVVMPSDGTLAGPNIALIYEIT
jgi:hypothetical protein